jgi:hypothetical protein
MHSLCAVSLPPAADPARNVLLQSATLALHFWEFFGVIWGAKKGNLKTPKNSSKGRSGPGSLRPQAPPPILVARSVLVDRVLSAIDGPQSATLCRPTGATERTR